MYNDIYVVYDEIIWAIICNQIMKQDTNYHDYSTVGKNIIATTKIRNDYGAIKSFISLLLLVKLSLLIPFASFLVSDLCFFFDGFLYQVFALSTEAIAIVVALSCS